MAPVIVERRLVELRHLFTQHAREPRDSLCAHRRYGYQRHDATRPGPLRASRSLSRTLAESSRSLPLCVSPAPASRAVETSAAASAKLGNEALPVEVHTRVGKTRSVSRFAQVLPKLVHGSSAPDSRPYAARTLLPTATVLQRVPRPSLDIAPDALLQVPYKHLLTDSSWFGENQLTKREC
jgi:hypothetical protein